MKIIYGVKKIGRFGRPVVAMGVFDGVHRGHSSILKAAVKKARSIRGTSVALTFWPHPQKQASLYSLEHRLRLFEELGIDVAIVINFNRNFSLISAFDFVKNILFRKIGARYIYVGKNFRFGKGALGDSQALKKFEKKYHYALKAFAVVKIKNKPVSSTYIRQLIKQGDLVGAEKLLTRRVSVLGTVVRGNALGRKIGFSTANINPHHEIIPPSGVYAVEVIYRGRRLKGICNIGKRPTLKNQKSKINPSTTLRVDGERSRTIKNQNLVHIEVHIFDFHKEIYGEFLEIRFIKKIREEKKFPSFFHLASQIKIDALKARAVLACH